MKKIISVLVIALVLVGCGEKEKVYECHDYNSITDVKIKEELLKRCPRLGGSFTHSDSTKGMIGWTQNK